MGPPECGCRGNGYRETGLWMFAASIEKSDMEMKNREIQYGSEYEDP